MNIQIINQLTLTKTIARFRFRSSIIFPVLLPGLMFFLCCSPETQSIKEENIFEFHLEPGPNDLFALAEYRIWIPGDVERLRGVIVHQHGCGRNGMLMAYDHHWRALARKWDCALLGTHYQAADSCASWYNPLNGSEQAFLTALTNFAKQSGHPELETVPWALWGHSGGAFWVSRMLELHPGRIVAVMARSGGYIVTNSEAFRVPVMFNYGPAEPPHINGITYYTNGRVKDAPWLVAPDPTTGHECGNSRLLAIPFLDACFELRLPDNGEEILKEIRMENSWLGDPGSFEIMKLEEFDGDPLDQVWLPNDAFARKWQEFVRTGWVTDNTPPPDPPYDLSYEFLGKKTISIHWKAEADLESGIKQFYLYRNDKQIMKYTGISDDYVKKNFQYGNYGDEPGPEALYENVEAWIPTQMEFTDQRLHPDSTYTYQIKMVNWSDLESEFSEPIIVFPKTQTDK